MMRLFRNTGRLLARVEVEVLSDILDFFFFAKSSSDNSV